MTKCNKGPGWLFLETLMVIRILFQVTRSLKRKPPLYKQVHCTGSPPLPGYEFTLEMPAHL